MTQPKTPLRKSRSEFTNDQYLYITTGKCPEKFIGCLTLFLSPVITLEVFVAFLFCGIMVCLTDNLFYAVMGLIIAGFWGGVMVEKEFSFKYYQLMYQLGILEINEAISE